MRDNPYIKNESREFWTILYNSGRGKYSRVVEKVRGWRITDDPEVGPVGSVYNPFEVWLCEIPTDLEYTYEERSYGYSIFDTEYEAYSKLLTQVDAEINATLLFKTFIWDKMKEVSGLLPPSLNPLHEKRGIINE